MKRARKRFISLLLSVVMVLGLIPAMPMTAVKANGSGDSWSDPILISTMDELIEELSKDTSEEQVKYYRLTQDVSYDTKLEKFMGAESDPSAEDAAKIDYKYLAQCVVGKGKKNLELMGHDVHYKNNINIGQHFNVSSYWSFKQGRKKIDSLTFFYLPEGADLTVSNTSRDSGQIWYDGRMNDRTGFVDGPRYTFTAVRDVFRVEAGAELTLNNTDVKAGRNRKIWMLNSYYISKQSETNLIASLTWVGYAYEQIYGSCVVVNGGKVTINGGLFDGRGGARDGYNVIGGYDEYYKNAFRNEPYYFKTDNMLEKFITYPGRKAAVQIAGEGSEVIINDGEFWGNGGANAIGINTLNGYNVKDYKLEIHAGTFDTSKTDKERLPDHCSKMSGNGIFYTVAEDFDMWGDCRITRDTPRGYIGFRAKDGRGNPVIDLSKSRIFVDDIDPEDEITSTEDADFYYKSDHDTIIVQPKEKDTFFSNTENAFGQKAFAIYATDARVRNTIGATSGAGNQTLKYDQGQGTLLWFTAESMYDLTDMDNFYLKQMSNVNCTWTLYEVTLDSDNKVKTIDTTTMTATPALTYVKDGKLLYVFRCELDNWQRTARSSYQWKQDSKVCYYMRASATESFTTSKRTLTTQMDNSDAYDYGTEREYAGGLRIEYQLSFQNNLNHPEFAVDYANARYGSDPKITLSDELQKLKSQQSACFLYQWQILKDGVWEDYGNWRISPDEAALILDKHYDLLGETMRLKVTEYDNKIKGVLYSKERVVTKGGSVGDDPITPAINVTEDPNHDGKYVFHIQVDSDAQEYLVISDDGQISASRRISFLDWSNATTSKEIDNLDHGAYIVYTRYAATATAEAGKKVAYSNAFAKVVLATEDIQISYVTRANAMIPMRNQPVLSSGDDFATYVNGGVRYFIVESLPYGANDEVAKSTHWWCADETILQPMKIQHDRVNGDSWVEMEWGNITGNTFAFKGIKAGTVELHAETTLLNGTVKDTVINVHVMPDAATPYKVTTTTEGKIVKLMPGQTYEPQLVVSPDTIQPDSSKLRWVRKNTTSTTPGVVVKTSTGVVTVGDDAQIGEIATICGQYTRGSGMTPLSFEYQVEVIASDETSAHAHPGEDHAFTTFQQYDENQHLQICACGETAYAAHEFQDKVIRQATNEETGILRHECKDCGYYYEESIPVGVHVHELYWNYDEDEHWQNCETDGCPEENYETGRGAHDFAFVGTTDDGQEIYACSVCGMMKQVAATLAITKQPESIAVEKAGDVATISIEATGENLSYTWFYKDASAADYTKSNIKTASVSLKVNAAKDGRQLYCVVTDGSGKSVTSDIVTVSIKKNSGLAITKQPGSVEVAKSGDTASISVEATGENLSYTWYYKDAGATAYTKSNIKTATVSLKVNAAKDGRQLYCVVTDGSGKSVTSDTVTVSIKKNSELAITKQPKSVEVAKSGDKATISVEASGENLSYTWYYKDAGATAYTKSNVKTATVSLKVNAAKDGRQMYCVVTDGSGKSVTSDTVTVSIKKNSGLAITKQPGSMEVAKSGDKATISVEASGENLSYTWYYKDAGATAYTKSNVKTATVSLKVNAAKDGRQMYCVVTDGSGKSVTSDIVTVSIKK